MKTASYDINGGPVFRLRSLGRKLTIAGWLHLGRARQKVRHGVTGRQTGRVLSENSKTVWVALPDGTPIKRHRMKHNVTISGGA